MSITSKITRRTLITGAAALASYKALAEGIDNSKVIGSNTFGGLGALGGVKPQQPIQGADAAPLLGADGAPLLGKAA